MSGRLARTFLDAAAERLGIPTLTPEAFLESMSADVDGDKADEAGALALAACALAIVSIADSLERIADDSGREP